MPSGDARLIGVDTGLKLSEGSLDSETLKIG